MNKWTVIAIFFTLLTLGALQESYAVFTSSDAELGNSRVSVTVIVVCMTTLFAFISVICWRKSARQKR